MPKKCPADYNDSMQTDSDFNNDSEYLQGDENELPEVSGEAKNAYRLRRRENKKSVDKKVMMMQTMHLMLKESEVHLLHVMKMMMLMMMMK